MTRRVRGTSVLVLFLAAAVLVFAGAVHGAHRHRVEACAACLLATGGALMPAQIPAVPCLLVLGVLPAIAVANPIILALAPCLVRGPPR